MLNLKWMYVTSVLVSTVIFSLYSHQNFSKPKPKSSKTAFTENINVSFPVIIGLAGTDTTRKKQTVNTQLYEDQQLTFTGSDENSTTVKEGSSNSAMSLLTLPFPSNTFSAMKLLQQQWVDDLRHILSEIPLESPPVHIVAGNYAYRELVLNWLITAKIKVTPPLSNIIVLSIDKALCNLLNKSNIKCLFVDRKAYLIEKIRQDFRSILILRLTVIRLLNYWGYNAANIDADAIMLKNPEPLYERYKESDMVAGRGTYPSPLGREWGATICGGTFMIRSTPNTENYWRTMSSISTGRKSMAYDDQVRLNYALKQMSPIWEDSSGRTGTSLNKRATLTAYASGFTVTLLPAEIICRAQCKEKLQSQYYVWHKLTSKNIHSKTANTGQARLWFLRKDWETFNNSGSNGVQWLKEISD